MTSSNWFLNEIANIFSNLPIALYALGFRIQDGLVSAVCNKAAAPMPFIGSVTDLKTVWNVKQTDLFGILGTGKQFQVASLRHGNSWPLVNRAVLIAAGCIEQPAPISVDLSQPRAITLNITFCLPHESGKDTQKQTKFVGLVIGYIELCIYIGSAVAQGLHGLFVGAALAVCLAICTFCYLTLQHLVEPIYAHKESIQNDLRRTVKNGAATDIHVIVPDWNSEEMYVLVGYSSYLHALTNIPARADKPVLLQWICRGLGVVLCVQAALLAKLVQAPPPALYGSPIWLTSTLAAYLIYIASPRLRKGVCLPTGNIIQLDHAPQIILPSRRAALIFISSLPISSSTAGRWDWVDPFMPANPRRQKWQQEIELANLLSSVEPKVYLTDDVRRIVSQVRAVRFDSKLVDMIAKFEENVGLNGNTMSSPG